MPMNPCPPRIRSLADYKAFQRVMSAALFRPLTPRDGMPGSRSNGQAMRSVAASFVKPNDRLSSFERLEIYHRQYWFRVLDCLHDDFPGLRALLGRTKFQKLSEAYLANFPSASWTLRNLGSRLVSFIAREPKWTAPKTGAALDMARFEWAQTLAFDEAGGSPVAGDDLLGSEADTLRLGLQPYLSLLELDHAVDDFALAAKQDDQGLRGEASNARGEAPQLEAAKRMRPPKTGRIRLAVHRFDSSIYCKRLEREAFLLLSALRAGWTLARAIDAGLAEADASRDWAAILRGWFENWAALGWFCRAGK